VISDLDARKGREHMKRIKAPARNLSARTSTPRPLRMLAVAALVAAPLVALFAAPSASSATPASVDLQSGAVSLKGGGYTWMLALNYDSVDHIGISIERFVTGNTGYELHSWSASTVDSSFTFSSSTGKATLSSGKSLSPVASFSVSFVPTKKTTTGCLYGPSESIYTGTLKGSVHLATGTKPVSVTLSSASASFSHGTNTLIAGPCQNLVPCTGDSWSAPESRNGPPSGSVAVAGGEVYAGARAQYWTTVIREAALSKPSALTRTDGASVEAPPPKWKAAAKTLTVSGGSSASGIVTGSGTLTGQGKAFTSSGYCTISGRGTADRITEYLLGAKLSKWKKFVAKTVLTGRLTASSTGVGGFVIQTIS